MAKIAINNNSINKTTGIFAIVAFLPHILCCVLPIMVAIIALGTTIGLGASLASNPFYSFLNQFHVPLLIFATIMVALSGAFNLYAYRIDCAKAKTACTHKSCKPKKLRSFRIFIISIVLLVLDISWFFIETNFLNLSS